MMGREREKEMPKFFDIMFRVFDRALAEAESFEDFDAVSFLGSLSDEEKAVVPKLQIPLLQAILRPKNRKIIQMWSEVQGIFWRDVVLKGIDEGKKLVYYFINLTPEVFYALDLIPLSAEYHSMLSAATMTDGCEDGIDRIEAEGFPTHLCTAQKGFMGWALMGKVPIPDILIKATGICDASNASYQWMAKEFGSKFIAIDCAYGVDKRASEYYVGEFKRAVQELEEVTGHKLDLGKLKELVEISNEAWEYFLDVFELRKAIPCPDPSLHHPLDLAVGVHSLGRPEAIPYFKTIRDLAKEKVKRGEGVIPKEKKEIRAVWSSINPIFDLGLLNWMEEELGMVEVTSTLSYWAYLSTIDTSSAESMFAGLAERSLGFPMFRQGVGLADLFVDDFVRMAKMYKADCCIAGATVGCKQAWGLQKLLSDAMHEEVGIPTLRLELDLGDKRFVSSEEIKSKIEDFVSTLE